MNRIKVLVVEDEWIVSEEIKELLTQSGYEVAGQVEDGLSALKIINQVPIDVVLLDINIKGDFDGIDLAKKILSIHHCAIIFLTAFDDEKFITRAKMVNPSAYIVKPFIPRNLQMAIEIAFNNLASVEGDPTKESYLVSDFIFLKEDQRFKRVSIYDIWYAKATGSYTEIFTESGKSTLAINLKTFEFNLKDPRFQRIHRSYLINLHQIDEYEGNRIYIKGTELPISASYKELFLKHFRFI